MEVILTGTIIISSYFIFFTFLSTFFTSFGLLFSRIFLMGQSAGAHIAACALLDQAIKESSKEESTSWNVSQIKAYFGLSGG